MSKKIVITYEIGGFEATDIYEIGKGEVVGINTTGGMEKLIRIAFTGCRERVYNISGIIKYDLYRSECYIGSELKKGNDTPIGRD